MRKLSGAALLVKISETYPAGEAGGHVGGAGQQLQPPLGDVGVPSTVLDTLQSAMTEDI